MNEITRGQRIYFATVGLLALWVGAWGTFAPAHADRALPWLVPPLHARFLGAVYLSAAFVLANGLVARRQSEVRAMTLLITLWTGGLLVLSLFHLEEFDPHHKPVWFWFGAYVVYPLAGVWSLLAHRARPPTSDDAPLPTWARRYLLVQGAGFVVLSLLLLAIPSSMVAVWPWKISPLLAQIYSAPFLAYGSCSWLLARGRTWPESRIVVRGAFVFAVFALVASVLHRNLFSSERVATWVWFAVFGVAAGMSGAMQVRFLRRGLSP
ncbi:MAG: hypothetical protein NTY35_02605 [Planctomycetota bacterium]|nr:hypothetical protein [Planctomycetota bacterium]